MLGAGSITGINVDRFKPDLVQREQMRAKYAVPSDAILLLFIGRLTRDKGVVDLVDAWAGLPDACGHVHLAIVGPDEDGLLPKIKERVPVELAGRMHVHGITARPWLWHQAADIVCLPSYREGLGTVVLEAAATCKP
ncbi:MAG: glycosyltransferase, partial [Gammaproteobacteria bacterium]